MTVRGTSVTHRLIRGLLAASALLPLPALAQRADRAARDPGERGAMRVERQERYQARIGADPGLRADRQRFRAERGDDRRDFRAERRDDRAALATGQVTREQFRADRRDDRRDFRDDRRDDRRDFRDDRRDDRNWNDRNRGDQGWNGRNWNGRNGSDLNWGDRNDRRWDGGRYDGRGGWSRDWRNDRRYDWNGWRDRNRQAYRLPRCYAPGGWNGGYRRFGTGVRLSALLFAQDYWIGDPGFYRLPPAWGPYRWVRYYDDALLVDVRYGTVVDTVYGIFW